MRGRNEKTVNKGREVRETKRWGGGRMTLTLFSRGRFEIVEQKWQRQRCD